MSLAHYCQLIESRGNIPPKGRRGRKRALTPEQIADVELGRMSQRAYAELYGVCRDTIQKVLNDKTKRELKKQ